jgi:phosphoribosylamine--glycine ligase
MKILIIGNGGREHAIAQALSQSRHQPELYFAQGNPGMRELGQRLDIEVTDLNGLLLFAQREKIDLTVVGPEVPLSLGISDRFREAGLKIFGPGQAGAQLESSKAFAKDLMAKYHIPTARYVKCPLDRHQTLLALDGFEPPYVIKEDGLAAGKGVTIAENLNQAVAAIDAALQKEMPVVIEEFMQGQELSVLAFYDGETILPCIAAQDFKKVGEGNTGPNTGGMGAYAPVPLATPKLLARAQAEVLEPMVQALKAEGIPYHGILYAGLMITPDGDPRVVEFNVRFGDPETQVVLPLLENDLVDVMLATVNGELHRYKASGIRFKPNASAVTVVLTSKGYPGDYQTGVPIQFPQYLPNDVHVFHAGTKTQPDQTIVTAGGRVLNVTGIGASLEEARQKAYAVASQIGFENIYYRKDIAATPALKP